MDYDSEVKITYIEGIHIIRVAQLSLLTLLGFATRGRADTALLIYTLQSRVHVLH